ncbi:MAG: hypothetical protein V3V18_07150 [Methylococcales bacterium]
MNAKFASWISITLWCMFLILLSFIFGMSSTVRKLDYYFLDCVHTKIVLSQTDKKVIMAQYDEKNNIIKYPIKILTISDSMSFYLKILGEPPKAFQNKLNSSMPSSLD